MTIWQYFHALCADLSTFRDFDYFNPIPVMNLLSIQSLFAYWSGAEVAANLTKPVWHFVAVASGRRSEARITDLAAELSVFDGVESFHLSHSRN